MAHRIDVVSIVDDPRSAIFQKKFQEIAARITNVSIVDSYLIDASFTQEQLKRVAAALINPLVQKATHVHPKGVIGTKNTKYTYVITIGYLPGVTDNVATTAKEVIEDLLKTRFQNNKGVYTSRSYFVQGTVSRQDAESITGGLYNPLIQRGVVQSYEEYLQTQNDTEIPRVVLPRKQTAVTQVDLTVDDTILEEIGALGIADPDGSRRGPLALSLPYMKTIQAHFKKLGRNPTDIELESIAQTWSEHCKHTIFADPLDEIKDGLYKTYIKGATEKIQNSKSKAQKNICLSVFTDNSGIIVFDRDFAITHKVETHNSPSALDPFGGAVTGIVGVNRDTIGTGMGAMPVINYYGFCLASPDDETRLYRDKELTQPMLSAHRILNGVVDGVNYGGNCSGIPTPQGFWYFHPRYRGKPLVFAGTVGLIPREVNGKLSYIKKARPGDYIVMVGGRVGLDGIHGVTFASTAITSGSPSTAVQIGDPITQKKLSDAIVKEARDRGLYTSITDNGGGGLSCSVAEMAKEAGGCEVDIEKVPVKYPGLTPWQIWISESQERITLAVPPEKWPALKKLLDVRGVEGTAIGIFTSVKKCVVRYRGKIIMDLEMEFLHNGLPKRPMKTKKPRVKIGKNSIPNFFSSVGSSSQSRSPKSQKNWYLRSFLKMLRNLNFASYEFIAAQYDHEVQGGSVLKPLQGRGRVMADATVNRPVLSSPKGVVLSQALYPEYTEIDPYNMAACAIDTAVRNAIAAGASLDHLALLDNFCWASSDEPERLWQLKEAVRACYDYAIMYGAPYISGKDSMFNDFKGYDAAGAPVKIAVPPTLLISAIGVMDDSSRAVSLDFKVPGDLIYIIGKSYEEKLVVPRVDAKTNKKIYRAVTTAIQKELVASSVSVHRGGLLYALARSAIGGSLGVWVELDRTMLFSESQGRILVSVKASNQKKFERVMGKNYYHRIGIVRKDTEFVVASASKIQIKTDTDTMSVHYKSTFKNY